MFDARYVVDTLDKTSKTFRREILMFEVFRFQPSPARVVNDLTFNSVTRRLGGRFYTQFIDYVFDRTIFKSNLNGICRNVTPYAMRTYFPSRATKCISRRKVAGTVGFD